MFCQYDIELNYTFQACTRTNTIILESPASVVPVIKGIVSLILIPSGEPPHMAVHESFHAIKKSREVFGGFDSHQPEDIPKKSVNKSRTSDEQVRKPTKSPEQSNWGIQNAEDMQAITNVAGEAAGAAARHLINFAALSIKSAQKAATAALSGQIQV